MIFSRAVVVVVVRVVITGLQVPWVPKDAVLNIMSATWPVPARAYAPARAVVGSEMTAATVRMAVVIAIVVHGQIDMAAAGMGGAAASLATTVVLGEYASRA